MLLRSIWSERNNDDFRSLSSQLAHHIPIDPTPQILDDVDTEYACSMPMWTSGNGVAEMFVRFAPTPPSAARILTIVAPKTQPFLSPIGQQGDSWTFSVSIRGEPMVIDSPSRK